MDLEKFVNDFIDEYDERLQREKNTLPLFHPYTGFGYIVSTLERAVSERCKNFENDIKKQLEELDNTPLTHKQYEEKKKEIQSQKNMFAYLVRHPKENPSSNQVLYKEITRRYMQAVLSEGLSKEEIDEEFRRVWEGMDFYSMFFYFDTAKYKYADDEDDEGSPVSTHYIYGHDTEYKYQENMLRHLLAMIKQRHV